MAPNDNFVAPAPEQLAAYKEVINNFEKVSTEWITKSSEINTALGALTNATLLRLRPSVSTPEQQKAYNAAIDEFRKILSELILKAGSVNSNTQKDKPVIRRFFDWINRKIDKVQGFDDAVAEYTKLLPSLERVDGQAYSQIALQGIQALKEGNLGISKTVLAHVLFLTAPSSALNSVLKGLGVSFVVLLILGLIVLSVPVAAPVLGAASTPAPVAASGAHSGSESAIIPTTTTRNYNIDEVMHIFIAFYSGWFGSVVSFLNRLSNFDSIQARSKSFLFAYGFTLPFIGGGFGCVLAAALDAGLISILSNKFQLFIVVGFLAGFSERFSKNLLDVAERSLGFKGG